MSTKGARRTGQRRKFEMMYRVLRTRICLLDYEPGQRLSEETLAEEFGVSRTPLRRVLARLESEGLVESVQSVGTIVTDVDLETLGQIFDLRMELAELLGRLEPAPVTPELIEHFRTILAQCDELASHPDIRRFSEINMDFLQALIAITENEPLREISERLYYQTSRIWIKSIPRMDFGREIQIFRREVADVLDAMETGDLEAIGHIRRSHISMSFRRLCQNKES